MMLMRRVPASSVPFAGCDASKIEEASYIPINLHRGTIISKIPN